MRDRRIALEKGTPVLINGAEYIIDECINSGGEALLYRCHLKDHLNDQRYILKEYYPPEAVRENGVIVEGPEWKYYKGHPLAYYRQKAKAAEEQVSKFRKNSHQAQFISEIIPCDGNMLALMRMASSDCKTIMEKLQEWYPEESKILEPAEALGRVGESVKIIKGLLNALIILHSDAGGNLVHRDLTPGNILIAESKPGKETEYAVYPIDFASCTRINSPFEEEVSVSPGFSHPMLRQNSYLLDLYSVAALLLVLVTGKECLHRLEGWEVKNLIAYEHCFIDAALATQKLPFGVKSKLVSILKRATAEAPERQYFSAKEMYGDLEVLEQIVARKGMHPEVLYDASAKEFKAQYENGSGIFPYKIEPDLLTDAVDPVSKAPVDLVKQNTILLGSGGAGKTTKIRVLWEQCLDAWKEDPENSPIPVFVPLNTFDSKKSNWDFFIRDYISEVYFPDLSADVSQRRDDLVGMFQSTRKTILFLDGINEAVDASMLSGEVKRLVAIENVTVIITSRNDLGDGWGETKTWFSTAELLPLGDDLIVKKLQQAKLNPPSPRLLRTLQRPMFLAMYIRLKIKDITVETSDQILHVHHNHLLRACEAGHHGANWENFVRFALEELLPQIASGIDRMHFHVDELAESLNTAYSRTTEKAKIAQIKGYFIERAQTIESQIVELYRNCGIMRAITDTVLTFTHQRYLDFYRALEFARRFPGNRKDSAVQLAEQHIVRPCNYLELKQYCSAEEIAYQLTQNDALLYPAESLKRHGGSPQLWAAHIRANPENWLFLWEEDTKKIVGNWSFVFISPEQEAEVKEGLLAEEQFLVTTRYDIASDPAEGCTVYLLNLSTNDGIEDNRLVLWQTFINRLLEIASKGVFLRGVYANALNEDNEGVFRSKGFVPVVHNINGGKIFYLDLSSGFPKALSYFTSDIDLESLYYQSWSKHVSFRQLTYDDVYWLSSQQQKQLAQLVWQTDPYIYPAVFFSQGQAELLLPRIFAENSDSMFSLNNIFCAMIGDAIVGMILFHKGPLYWSATNLKRWSKSLPPTIDIVEREYFADYRKTPPNCISIINCCVDEKWRNRGVRIGSKMLEEFLKLHKTETIDLYVLEESANAVTLYLRHDFKMVSVTEGFSVEPKDLPCYYMKRHPAEEVVPTVEQIVNQVAAYYCVEAVDILGMKKGRAALARKVSFYLIRKLTWLSLQDIAKEFNRDYSTVIYAIQKIQKEIDAGNSEIKTAVKNVLSAINAQY